MNHDNNIRMTKSEIAKSKIMLFESESRFLFSQS